MARSTIINVPKSAIVAPVQTVSQANGQLQLSPNPYQGVAMTLQLSSLQNLSAIQFTIIGRDQYDQPIQEQLNGPNNNGVKTANQYRSVQSITASASFPVGAVMVVTTGDIGTTLWVPMNVNNIGSFETAITCEPSGDILHYTLQYTNDPLEWVDEFSQTKINSTPVTFPEANGSNVTGKNWFTLTTVTPYVQVAILSGATQNSMRVVITQQGIV